jgi:hypothetical protein
VRLFEWKFVEHEVFKKDYVQHQVTALACVIELESVTDRRGISVFSS